jgi:hypothetical protein
VLLLYQGGLQAGCVDPPEVMDVAVHEDHGNLLGVAIGEFRVVEEGDFGPRHAGGGADVGDHGPSVVAEMAARPAHEDHPLISHPLSLAE